MPYKQILIASILKPINDTRMVEKLGFSLSKINGIQINIAGFAGKIPRNTPFTYHPLFKFDRLSFLRRIRAPFKYYRLLRKVKPQLIIIETHELLLASVLYKIFHRTALIYDIRENYYLNILHGSGFRKSFRWLIAHWVRLSEIVSAPAINHFILAENVYSKQLRFSKNRSTVLPNAFNSVMASRSQEPVSRFQLLFSGTIARETGILEAISLIKVLHSIDSRFKLKILGNCNNSTLYKELLSQSSTFPFIEISKVNKLVPHQDILDTISHSAFGFVHYHELPQIQGKIPTKVFEYVGNSLPIILLKNEAIGAYLRPIADFVHLSSISEIETHKIINFSPATYPAARDEVFWHHYEARFLQLIDKHTNFSSS